MTSGDHPSSDEEDHDNDNDQQQDRRHNRESGLPGSPLSKVFGRRSTLTLAKTKTKSSQGKAPHPASTGGTDTGSASKDEVNQLKAELTEVRASQLRMEEMLSKMLSGTGVDDK